MVYYEKNDYFFRFLQPGVSPTIDNHMDTQKLMQRVKPLILALITGLLLASPTFLSATEPPSTQQAPAQPGLSGPSQVPADSQTDDKKKGADWIWIAGEIAMFTLTSLIILSVYSWHLRVMVAKKTRELKNLNIRLEYKVEERTAKLKKSQEDYKAMYMNAEKERKRTKLALQSEREAIQQNLNFMDMISHEYRTPLSVITANIELVEKKCLMEGFSKIDNQIGKMKLSAQRLIDIFQSSLGKDRLDTLTPRLRMERLALVSLISSAVDLTKTAYTDYQITFNSAPYGNIRITADEKLMITVFKNLLDNACKYSEPDHPVLITVDVFKDRVDVNITDNGMGIGDHEAGQVFEKYYRSERTGKKQGAGLGLFLVKTIVDLHQGEVKLSSRPNAGTRMTVCLPKEKNA